MGASSLNLFFYLTFSQTWSKTKTLKVLLLLLKSLCIHLPAHVFSYFSYGDYLCLLSLFSLESVFFRVEQTLASCSQSNPPCFHQGAAFAHHDSPQSHDLLIWTDGSVPLLFGNGGSGVLANCSLCGPTAALSFLEGPVCSSIFAEACTITFSR